MLNRNQSTFKTFSGVPGDVRGQGGGKAIARKGLLGFPGELLHEDGMQDDTRETRGVGKLSVGKEDCEAMMDPLADHIMI